MERWIERIVKIGLVLKDAFGKEKMNEKLSNYPSANILFTFARKGIAASSWKNDLGACGRKSGPLSVNR